MARELTVPGNPVPQGSMRAFAVQGRAFTTATNIGPLQRYRNDIRAAYGDPDINPTDGPVYVRIHFRFRRPNSHYTSKGVLKNDTYKQPAPALVIKKPDIDKLVRAVLDALTGYAYLDDAQVSGLRATKAYDHEAYTMIYISPVEAGAADEPS